VLRKVFRSARQRSGDITTFGAIKILVSIRGFVGIERCIEKRFPWSSIMCHSKRNQCKPCNQAGLLCFVGEQSISLSQRYYLSGCIQPSFEKHHSLDFHVSQGINEMLLPDHGGNIT